MMDYVAKSHCGMVRELNEDNFAVKKTDEFDLIIVADGMGGHQAGEVASETAVNKIAEYITEHGNTESIPQLLEEAMLFANETIYQRAKQDPNCASMGTTAVLCYIKGNDVYFANVGDSRAYLLGLSGMEQVTEDHSLVMELLRQGEITREEAEHHPQKNVITRALGTERTVETDVFHCELEPEDMILLCSDGLTGMLSDTEIAEIMWSEGSAEEHLEQLISIANQRGGYDNITIVVGVQKKEG